MKDEHQEILKLIGFYLEAHPGQRFGQALFNLAINEFHKNQDPRHSNSLRDIYNDIDQDIIIRIRKQLEWFEIQKEVNRKLKNAKDLNDPTINERLEGVELFEIFNKIKETRIDYAKYILRQLNIDHDSIERYFQ